ncbi:glycosyltransferase family 2 protein [Pedobacter rhizosphaerae]|uniref:Glycosyl transferase family 2 n=1 Tax=Pedobacter rhizosphaerae TaxID=390241 RepID=A0A1H9N6B1_9SPHI|nr:glycosyltransferase family 2 protein [Pedobacter rhizosphaerae]SER31516.1 Glycosyl transferase family 2 [Pedobacter rhizosphaerae]
MTSNPLISICIPCYNAEKYISETLDCFLRQTYQHFELIVANDHSSDDSLKILKNYEHLDNRIKIIDLEKNRGAAAARNSAFNISSGLYVIFFDSDDLVSDNYLETQLELAKINPQSIIACELKEFYNNDINNTRENPSAVRQTLPPIDWLMADNAKGLNLTQCGMFLIPREMIEKSGLWTEKLSLIDDFDFFPRLLLKAELIIYNPNTTTFYRRDVNSSLSNFAGPKALKSAFEALCATTTLLLTQENSSRVKLALANYWRGWVYHFYGSNMSFYQYGINQVKVLTGKKYTPNNSGITGILDKIIGWKLTKKLKNRINAR